MAIASANCRKTAELSENQDSSSPIDRKAVRKALRCWDSASDLGKQPLSDLAIVEARREAAGYSTNEVGLGVALRDVLQVALDDLALGEGAPDPLDKQWRTYLILTEQYLKGRSPEYLAQQMGIARSTFNHEQADALDQMAGLLREWETHGLPPGTDLIPPPEERPGYRPPPFTSPPKASQPIVGREGLLGYARTHLLESDQPILALHGLPGVGKTALAVELAHDPEIRTHYDEGVLWAGLGQAPNLEIILQNWGAALGFTLDEIRVLETNEEKVQLLHTAIGTKRILLVLDDLWNLEHGLVLQLGGPNCGTVITTRSPATALEVGGEVLPIPELEADQGLELIRYFAPKTLRLREQETSELVGALGGLPLALVLIGSYLRREAYSGHPRRQLTALEKLMDPGERQRVSRKLSPLQQQPTLLEEQEISLEIVIRISDDSLSEDARYALYALSIFPSKPNTFDEEAALRITGQSVNALDELVDAGLLEPAQEDRFTLHGTLAEYATGMRDDEAVSRRFVQCFMEYTSLHTDDYPALGLEYTNIVAALDEASQLDMCGAFVQGVGDLYPHLEAVGLLEAADNLLERSLECAQEEGDRAGLARTLVNRGRSAQRRGNYEDAVTEFELAGDIALDIDDQDLICAALQGLGVVSFSQGAFDEAEGYYTEGLERAREASLTTREAALLSNLGTLMVSKGELPRARELLEHGLKLARLDAGHTLEGAILSNLGAVSAQSGDYDSAKKYFQESLELARTAGNRRAMAFLLSNLGTYAYDQGDLGQAETYFKEALDLSNEIGDRARCCHLCANLTTLETSRGDYGAAEQYLEKGLVQAREIGHQETLCLLLINQVECSLAQGKMDDARKGLDEGLQIIETLLHPRYRCTFLLLKGEWNLRMGNVQRAEQAYIEAKDLAVERGFGEMVEKAEQGLATIRESGGREQPGH